MIKFRTILGSIPTNSFDALKAKINLQTNSCENYNGLMATLSNGSGTARRFLSSSSTDKNMNPNPTPSSTNAQTVPNRVEKTINQITLLGRVGADPQKRGTQEHPVVVFSLATHANYQYGSGDLLQKTDWHRICVFKPYLRDTVYKFMNKGQRVLVQGRLTYGEVKDESGSSHITASIIADDVTFFSKSPNDMTSSES